MKALILTLLLVISAVGLYSQSTLPLRADTILIEKAGGNANLKLKDASRDSTGGLYVNIGGGVLRAIKTKKINDSTYKIGLDTLRFNMVGGGSADSSIFATLYRVDTAKVNIRTQIDGKQPIGNYITATTGDVSITGPGSVTATINNNVVTNAKTAQMAAHTFKGNNTGSTANASDLTATQLTAELNVFGASTKGLVPAASGSPSSTKYLSEDGTFSTPSGTGSGVTTMTAIGSSPNANGATISSTNLTLQPADSTYGGVITASEQYLGGRKNILGKTSNFNGLGPKLNTQMLAPAKEMDSIYVSGKYLGFGFCGVFKSGIRVIIFVKADNHVGGNSIIMRGRSYDQGRTYTIDTLINELHGGVNDTLVTMGGGGIGPDNRLIIFYKRFRFSSPNFFPIDQRIAISDDEGSTIRLDQSVSNGGNDEYLPYGGLVHCANGELLLPWYGQTGSTYNVYVIKSTDGGLTWGSPITVFSNIASQRTESTFEHLGGGVIIGLMRSEVADTLYGQVISYDNGATWAYQGQVSFGIKGTPAWLSAFRSQNGKMAVACYYRVGTDIRALYSYADSTILGPSHWDLTKEVTIATDVQGSGYINICHPYQNMEGWGYYYDETIAQTNATIKWVKVPLGGSFPIGVGTGISGLTIGRIPVASSSTSLTDYSTLKYNNSSKAIVLNGATGDAWDASHNGGVIETSKAAIALNDGGNGVSLLDNMYITTDYTYKTSGLASMFNLRGGAAYFYGVASGTAGTTASLSERFRIGNAGDIYFNGSAGISGQVPVSAGPGSATVWTTYTPSQWVNVTGGINFPGGGYVGINTATPIAPLHITGATSGNNTTVIIDDDNSTIGSSIAFGYRSMTSPLKKYFGWVMDNNGMNFVKYLSNTPASPSTLMLLSHGENLIIGSTTDNGNRLQVTGNATLSALATGGTAPSTSGTTKMVIVDANGLLSFDNIPSGGSGITSINSQTGSSQTIASGKGVSVNSASDIHTISLDNTLDVQYTDANNSGTSETDLYTKTIAANQLSANGNSIGFEIRGDFANDATNTINLTLYFAGISFSTTGDINTPGNWTIKGTIVRTGTGSARMFASISMPSATTKTLETETFTSSGIDYTTTNVFKITGTAGGATGGSNDITARYWKVIYQP